MDVTTLQDKDLFQAWLNRMPESRRKKVKAYRYAEGSRLSLGVGILLFQAMERGGINPGCAEVRETEFGRPYLPDYPEFHFSLSHSGDWAMCAVSGHPVGCDAEKTGRGDERIAERFFHPEEREALRGEEDRAAWKRLFTRIWVRKESHVKLTGRGLGEGLSHFSAVSPEQGLWYAELEKEEYAFACCVRSAEKPSFRWREIPAAELWDGGTGSQ